MRTAMTAPGTQEFKAALRENGLTRVRVIASDDWKPGKLWAIASDMKRDPALNQAIDLVGGHTPHEDGYPTADTLSAAPADLVE